MTSGAADRALWPRYSLDADVALRIERIAGVLRGCEQEAEAARFLPQEAVDAMLDAGLFHLSFPTSLGGWEADAVVEMEVYESVARLNGAAGWNLCVGALHSSLPAAYLSDDAVAAMFGGDRPPVVAGQMQPVGRAVEVDGGMVVTGLYSWGSGIRHADWVLGGTLVEARDGTVRPGFRVFVAPKAQAEVLDNWHVMGMSGSGSYDYRVDGVLVPDGWWFDYHSPERLRGGHRYRSPVPVQIASAHIGFALGLGERAVEEITALAVSKRRSLATRTVADRGSFQRDLGSTYTALGAARDHAAATLGRLVAAQVAGADTAPMIPALRSAASHATDVALQAADTAMRHAGGTAVRLDNPIQRVVRDLLVARSHMYVADTNYELLGRALLDGVGPEAGRQEGYSVPDPVAAAPPPPTSR